VTVNRPILFLIDAHNLIYKAYYAFLQRPLYSRSGKPTSAVFGFTRMLLKLLKSENPEYLGISFDPGGKTSRHEVYAEYKANRPPMPADLVEQIPVIKEIVDAYDIKIIEKKGIEADDLMAFISSEAGKNNFDVYLLTSDKDIMQLVSDNVIVLATKKGLSEIVRYDSQKVKEEYGVTPGQIPDYLAFVGDKVDNIPGVPGIGPKKASELLQQFRDLDDLYENIDLIKSARIKKLLTDNRDQAYISRDLISLEKNIDLVFNPEEFRMNNIKTEKLISIFRELDFAELQKELTVETSKQNVVYETVENIDLLKNILNDASQYNVLSLDLETTSPDPMRGLIVGISLSFEEKRAYYIPTGHSDSNKNLDLKRVLELLSDFLRKTEINVVGHNIKYDWLMLRRSGLHELRVSFDTMIASHLINPSRRQHNLDAVAAEYLNIKKIPITELIGKGRDVQTMNNVSVEKVSQYACEDADVTFRLSQELGSILADKELTGLCRDVEIPLIEVLVKMEEAGVMLDTGYLSILSETMGIRLEELQSSIHEIAGQDFNINSPKQMQSVLYDKMGFPTKGIKKLKTGYSTDEKTLQHLARLSYPMSNLPETILEYRSISKLKSTYVDSLPKMVNPDTCRVHTSFNQTVTETGRLSSSEPNLQNIPIRTPAGKEIRRAIIPGPGNAVLLSADYSQIELRILAHMSRDKNMIEAFQEGRDIHNHTASEVFGVHPELVDSEMRRKAKMINFGIDYGMTEYGLATRLGIGIHEAKEYIHQYLSRYSGIKKYIENTVRDAGEKGFVTTLLNRRRYLPEIRDPKKGIRQAAERKAVNMPIQGTAADMIKIAMIQIHHYLKKNTLKTRMIIQVHDELIFEIPEDELEEVKKNIKKIMENAMELIIPVIVDISCGSNWAELK